MTSARLAAAILSLGLSETRWGKSIARRALRKRLIKRLRLAASDYDRSPARSLLVIAPHPDDESLGCGSLIAQKREAGATVRVVFLTDGSASHPKHPSVSAAQLRLQRNAEALAALAHLGVDRTSVYFFNLPDGQLDRLDKNLRSFATDTLRSCVEAFRPDEIALPSRLDNSTEHEAAHRLVLDALQRLTCTPTLLEFPIWAWWNPLRIDRLESFGTRTLRLQTTPAAAAKKAAAIASHVSQVQPTPPWKSAVLSQEFIEAFSGPEEFYFENPLKK